MPRLSTLLVFLTVVFTFSCSGDEPEPTEAPPLGIKFRTGVGTLFAQDSGVPSCAVPAGRRHCYDPGTGVFHIQFVGGGESTFNFEITRVNEHIATPIAFRLSGVPADYGCLGQPLALSLKGKEYPLVDSWLGRVDETLFRVERDKGTVIIAFTEKGQRLLEPGARIGFSIDNNW